MITIEKDGTITITETIYTPPLEEYFIVKGKVIKTTNRRI